MSKFENISNDDLKNVSGGYMLGFKPRFDKAGQQVEVEYDIILVTTPSEDLCLRRDKSWMDYLPSSFDDNDMLFEADISEKTIESYLKMKCLQRHGFKMVSFDK